MSVIQKIRDKYARVAVIAIALALLGFILTDYISGRGRGRGFSSGPNTVGRVNGKKIDLQDFTSKVNQQEAFQKSRGYSQGGEADRQRIIESVWDQEVSRVLYNTEISRLGISVGKRELNDMLFGANPPEDIKRAGTDPKTGVYNPAQAQQAINDMKKRGTKEQIDQFNIYLNEMEYLRLVDKYNSLLTGSINFPRWMLEKQNADNSLMAKVSLVKEVYSSIPDTAIKINDKEIQDYINKHKDDFKQEESRSIAYVSFSARATVIDSVAIREQVAALKAEFDTTKDVETFLNRYGTSIPYFNGNMSKNQIQVPFKDSIFKLPVNAVFGPYLDAGSYVLAKLVDVKTLPDSVKCRHILLGTMNPQTGQPVMEDSIAHKLADSIALTIRNGANFDTLETKFTTDEAAHKDKGVMTFSSSTIQGEGFAKEFAQFILFDGKPGDKKVVKTQFGWHYIEVLSFINPQPHYKIAYLAKPITASKATDDDAIGAANMFAGDSRDPKSFDANYEKNLKPKGLLKGIATDIRPTSYELQGLGASRSYVLKIYDAKLGEVLQPERIGDDYVVGVVVESYKEGTQTVARARNMVEPLLRNKKKAEQIKQRIGKITTLEAAASVLGKPIEVADSLRMTTRSTASIMGYEPKVNGAAFNPANKGKVVPEALEGRNGVYVVRVDDVTATAVANANVAEQRKAMYQQYKQQASYAGNAVMTALRKAATITDKRASIRTL